MTTPAPPQLMDELSIYLLPGRVSDPARALIEAREAERLGFGRVWLAERPDLKEAAVVCGAVAASTERIGVGTGLVIDAVRHPLMTAAFGATMQAMFGDRFTPGLTRGVKSWVNGLGLRGSSPAEFERYVAILRGLWAGDRVPFEGETGECHLEFVDDLRGHPVLAGSRGGVADLQFTRAQLVEVGRTLPEEWMRSGAALGSAKDCCDRMREYLDAGVDEIWIHGTSPSQNAGLVDLWRREYRTRRSTW